MKRYLLIVAVIITVVLTGCKTEGEKLRDEFRRATKNLTLPMATPIGNMVEAGIEGDGLYYTLKLKDDYARVVGESKYAENPKFGAMGFLSEIVKGNPIKEEALKESGLWIRYSYLNLDGDTVKIMLVENEHLVEALRRLNDANGEPLYEKEYYMMYIVDNAKAALPVDFGNGVIYSDVLSVEDSVVYKYILVGANKAAITPEMLSTSREMLKKELVGMYAYMKYMIEDLSKLGVSLKYAYENEVGESLFDIEFTAQEIADEIHRLI